MTAEHRQPERRGKLRRTSVAWQPWVSLFFLLSLQQHTPHPFSIRSKACTRILIWQPKAMVEPIRSQRCIRTSLAACMLALSACWRSAVGNASGTATQLTNTRFAGTDLPAAMCTLNLHLNHPCICVSSVYNHAVHL